MKNCIGQDTHAGKAIRQIVWYLLLVAASGAGAWIMARPVMSSASVSTWEWVVFGLLVAALGVWGFFVMWPTDDDIAVINRHRPE